MRTLLCPAVALVVLLSGVYCVGEPMTMDNGYFRLVAEDGRLSSLQVDATGQGQYGANWLIDMGFDGLAPGAEVLAARSVAGLRFENLDARESADVQIGKGHRADLLTPGHSLGQSFRLDSGEFERLQIHTPTWHTSDSGAVLVLRRDGPTGPMVAQAKLSKVPDNSWQELTFEPQSAGVYYVELSQVEGQIGWWSSPEDLYAQGQAYVDGEPAAGGDRDLRVRGTRAVGSADVDIDMSASRLRLTCRLRPNKSENPRPGDLLMKVRWDNEGYDVSAKSVPFSRFHTSTMRYMPVQQLKRWKEREGRYELSFGGCEWIEADGTETYDLRFEGTGLGLSWTMEGKQTTMRWPVRSASIDGAVVSRLEIAALPREDNIPPDWPRFVLPDETESAEANRFLYERAFTYPPVWGPGAWIEWNTLARCWQGGRHIAQLADFLARYPISDEGYVHTWGGNPGWPFPDNSKYDTRHFDTNARFILGCCRYGCWTRDVEFLRGQAGRIRRAMEYQLSVLQGKDGLIISASKDVNGRHEGVGNNYWDILPFGHLDAYANAVWYASLEAMAQLETLLGEIDGLSEGPAGREPDYYRALAAVARRRYNDTFWDPEKGRYIGCVDVDGKKHDYGFTFVNLEAMAYGLATDEQARRIYQWMQTEPTSSGEPDTYSRWIFAPRATTLHNPPWNPKEGKLADVPQDSWWHFGWRGTDWEDQCQDGGAILYTSFFDLVARCQHLGGDSAMTRWREIVGRWRMPDHLCGGPPLYRGEHPQQISAGAVGTDIPFPESGLVPCWLLYGLLGVQASCEGLIIVPRLPGDIPSAEVRNVAYRGLLLDIAATREQVTVSCRQPGYEFTWRKDLDEHGGALFVEPPAPVEFPAQPTWQKAQNWRAQWIWLQDPEAPQASFRYAFDLPAKLKQAWLSATADNSFVLVVNGKEVAEGEDWSQLQHVTITDALQPGKNVITVQADNAGGAGGFVLQGECIPVEGKSVPIATSSSWRVAPTAPEGWQTAGFDDSGWAQATEHGCPPCDPWGDIGVPDPGM